MFEVSPQPADLGRVRLAVTDMDGSLLLDDSTLPEGVEERIDALESVGAEFAIASGRPLYTLRDNLGNLLDKLMVVADNGGLVVDHGRKIFQTDLSPEAYHHMARVTAERGDLGFVCGIDGCYVDAKAKPYEDFIRTFYTRCTFVDDLTQVDVPADKYTVLFPNNDAMERIGSYREQIGSEFTYCCGGIMWVDIVPDGVSKGTALSHVSQIMGIPTADMAAFGDAPNDAEMLETVGFGYMMANAVPEMREYADYVAPSNEDRGVLKVIDQIVAARRAVLNG